MVEAMLARGLRVKVYNRSRAKAEALVPLGAVVADSPEDAAQGATRVHIALSDDAAVDATLDAASPGIADATPVIDHSTTSPAGVRARVDKHARFGFVHAPVFMSPAMCRQPGGIMLVSGERARVDAVRDELAKMTGKVMDLGERPDLAACFKLFGNAMIFALVGGIADVFSMARAEGIEPAAALALFEHFQVGGIFGARGKKMAAGDFTPSFHLSMARKDIGLMLDLLASSPEASAVLGSVAARFDARIAAGDGALDLGVIGAPPER
jgi:3-hydroxyisobutyrate dehydrogenase